MLPLISLLILNSQNSFILSFSSLLHLKAMQILENHILESYITIAKVDQL